MAEITEFKPRKPKPEAADLIWACNCGCALTAWLCRAIQGLRHTTETLVMIILKPLALLAGLVFGLVHR